MLIGVMVMMGCYGNAQHKQEMNTETVGELFKNHTADLMAKILLNVWEVENSDSSMKQRPNGSISADIEMPHNDRSACSCLVKDFANLLVLRTTGDSKIDEDLKNAGPGVSGKLCTKRNVRAQQATNAKISRWRLSRSSF
jgi:hypothetical protein